LSTAQLSGIALTVRSIAAFVTICDTNKRTAVEVECTVTSIRD
jgi:hypothetical protein